jgi:hypothetical protein
MRAVSEEYEETIARYVRYQDHLFATGQLSGFELKTYLRRRRQTLLWKLLLDETIEGLPALPGDGAAELKRHVARALGEPEKLVDEEIDRVLALGALRADPAPGGTRFRWSD